MGCDIYLHKVLKITHNKRFVDPVNSYSYIILSTTNEYTFGLEYNIPYDSDEDDYEIKKKNYRSTFLETTSVPILIYKDGSFNCTRFEDKYLPLIREKIIDNTDTQEKRDMRAEQKSWVSERFFLFDEDDEINIDDYKITDTGMLTRFEDIICIEKVEIKKWRL